MGRLPRSNTLQNVYDGGVGPLALVLGHERDLAALVDDHGGALRLPLGIIVEAEALRDGALRVEVGEQRVAQTEVLDERRVRPVAVDAHAEHLRVDPLELTEVVLEAGELLRAGWAEVERVEREDDVALAAEVAEADL